MTVAELISELQKINPNTKIVVYHAGSEDDGALTKVESCTVREYRENTYCQGDSCLEVEDEAEMICKISCNYHTVR